MRIPYLDQVHPSTLKVKIRLGLIALPLVLGAAAFYPAYLLLLQVFPLFGVNPELPLDAQNRGGVAIVVLAVILLAGFFVGSFIGFFANTIICRYFFEWDKSKVDTVFYKQVVPDSWRVDRRG